MLLTNEQKNLILGKSIYEQVRSGQSVDMQLQLNDIAKTFLSQFGLPYSGNNVEIQANSHRYHGIYEPRYNQIVLYSESLEDNNFKYFRTLTHEATHLLQYFLVKNGISRNSIDNLTPEKYQKMCQKFYKDKTLQVDKDMFEKFKHFVKSEPFLENEKMKYMIQDHYKYIGRGAFYYNNITEIMANAFALKEMRHLINEYQITESQKRQIEDAIIELDTAIKKSRPERKLFHSVVQNILPLIKTQTQHIITLASMKLSPIVKQPIGLMQEIKDNIGDEIYDAQLHTGDNVIYNCDKAEDKKEQLTEQQDVQNEQNIGKESEQQTLGNDFFEENEQVNCTTPTEDINKEK